MTRIISHVPSLAGPLLRMHFHDCFVNVCTHLSLFCFSWVQRRCPELFVLCRVAMLLFCLIAYQGYHLKRNRYRTLAYEVSAQLTLSRLSWSKPALEWSPVLIS
jgi:hypothetical protein